MLKTYIEISMGVSAVILINLLLTPVFSKRYSARWRYAVWILCAFLLLIPYRPDPRVKIDVPDIHSNQTADYNTGIQTESLLSENITAADSTAAVPLDSVRESTALPDTAKIEKVNLYTILTAVWLFGASAFMLYYIIGYILFRRRIKPWLRPAHPDGYSAKPRLVQCALIKSPVLTGFVRPMIILPKTDYTNDELDMILKHELTHYRRGDLWLKLLFIVSNAVHWFNPLVYILRRAANRDMEYSCDERVVRNTDISFRRGYSMTILRCASGGMRTTLSTYFSEDKKNLKNRFSNILSSRKKRGLAICALLAVLAVVCAGIFGFADRDSEKTNYLFLGDDGRGHIDTIMCAEVSERGISVTSIPRDTMYIDSYVSESSKESAEKILSFIPNLTGHKTDKYVMTNIDGAVSILSEFSGVKFDIPDLYGNGEGMVYDDASQNLHINLAAGEHELTGAEMMQIIRYRKSNVNSDGQYRTYSDGNLGRINMTHSLLNEIINQKKDILRGDNILASAQDVLNASVTNLDINDLDKIFKAAKKGNITFKTLEGDYGKEAVTGKLFYAPDTIYDGYGYSSDDVSAVVYAHDSTKLLCEVTSLTIDGEEQIAEVKDTFGVWYNERLNKFHLCLIPEIKDGNFISVQPFSNIGYSGGGQTSGVFVLKISMQREAGVTRLKAYFDGTITGLDTDTPVLRSDDGKYIITLKVVK